MHNTNVIWLLPCFISQFWVKEILKSSFWLGQQLQEPCMRTQRHKEQQMLDLTVLEELSRSGIIFHFHFSSRVFFKYCTCIIQYPEQFFICKVGDLCCKAGGMGFVHDYLRYGESGWSSQLSWNIILSRSILSRYSGLTNDPLVVRTNTVLHQTTIYKENRLRSIKAI